MNPTAVRIPCCLCGTLIYANASNKCGACLASEYDLTGMLQRGPSGNDLIVYQCRECRRFQRNVENPNSFQAAEAESPELLALLLYQIPALRSHNKQQTQTASHHHQLLHLVDAKWIWTEPHSMRYKLHLTVRFNIADQLQPHYQQQRQHQQDSSSSSPAAIQQRVILEFKCQWKQCSDCNREFTNRTWHALVQLRQARGVTHLAALEMAIAKNPKNIRKHVLKIQALQGGFDFYFLLLTQAQAFVQHLQRVAPLRVKTSQKIVSTNVKSNTSNMKYTLTCDAVPLCKHDLLLISKHAGGGGGGAAQKLAGRIVLVQKITSVLSLIDASPSVTTTTATDNSLLQMNLSAETFYKHEKQFQLLLTADRLVRFVVLDINPIHPTNNNNNIQDGENGKDSKDFTSLYRVCVAREADLGTTEQVSQFQVITHLGNILQTGDVVMGYDLETAVTAGDENPFDKKFLQHHYQVPEVVLVKKAGDFVVSTVSHEHDDAAAQQQQQQHTSKSREKRKLRKEGKKKKALQESAVRMGFVPSEEQNEEEEEQGIPNEDLVVTKDEDFMEDLQDLEMALNEAIIDNNNDDNPHTTTTKEPEPDLGLVGVGDMPEIQDDGKEE